MYPSIKERIQERTPEADKVFKQAYIRELIDLWDNHELTLSRLTEILNEDAFNYYDPKRTGIKQNQIGISQNQQKV
jgi:hypothetical protein